MNFIYVTGVLSLLIQIITGIFDIYVLTLPVSPPFFIIKELLVLEIIVQFVEGGFYTWLITQFQHIKNITKYRYYDWIITTPTMLLSLCIYFVFLNKSQTSPQTIYHFLIQHGDLFFFIVLLNALMLLFGYLGEIRYLSYTFATLLGFLPFIIYFIFIYIYFAKWSEEGKMIFWIFFSIWTMYGIASLFSYRVKNIMYNILDLFAKNLFGICLGIVILSNQIFLS